jgi:clan AA aspartic protease
MGTFRVTIEIALREEGPYQRVETLVDRGALYTWLPASILEGMGVKRTMRRHSVLADGRTIERDLGQVVVRINGQPLYTLCTFGDEGPEPLLGSYTLEGFALAPDPVNQRLVPMPRLYLL